MSDEEDSTEKEHEPSQKRLEEAREKGEIARSPDLTTAASYAGFLLAAIAIGGEGLQSVGQTGAVLLDQADRLAPLMMEGGSAPFAGILAALGLGLAPFFLLPALAAILVILAQRALIFTPDKLAPKLSRISPISIAKQKFGRSGLFEFAKSFVKLGAVSTVLGFFLVARLGEILGTLYLTPALTTSITLRLVVEFIFLVLLIALLIGGLDYLFQHIEHQRQHRMSRKELMDEMKQSEGDPYMKAQRRQRGYDIATNRMLADVPTADVIVVNPTHYAVALKWNRADRTAPICVAKGVDEVAARIREKAAEAGVPIHRDPPTARALHATVEIGQEIRPEHFRAVAAAVRFAEAMRAKAKARR